MSRERIIQEEILNVSIDETIINKPESNLTLKEFFNPAQITMIVSVISIFGFLNRWNDTFGTTIEKIPRDFVEEELIPLGWKK